MPKTLMLERVSPELSAEEFFAKYVSKRRPVILTGLIDDVAFQGRNWVGNRVACTLWSLTNADFVAKSRQTSTIWREKPETWR